MFLFYVYRYLFKDLTPAECARQAVSLIQTARVPLSSFCTHPSINLTY